MCQALSPAEYKYEIVLFISVLSILPSRGPDTW